MIPTYSGKNLGLLYLLQMLLLELFNSGENWT